MWSKRPGTTKSISEINNMMLERKQKLQIKDMKFDALFTHAPKFLIIPKETPSIFKFSIHAECHRYDVSE